MTETENLEKAFGTVCEEVGMKKEDREVVRSLLAPLRDKSPVTHVHYLHSLRVALTCREIAKFQHMEEKPLLFAGTLHDIGKALVPEDVLGKTGVWTNRDQALIQKHVMDGYRLLRGRFDFSADIMLWHHRFQAHAYPKKMPKQLHPYSTTTSLLVAESGRMLALAVCYDALHRSNAKFGKVLTREEVKEKMFAFNPDRKKLIGALYDAGILGGETRH